MLRTIYLGTISILLSLLISGCNQLTIDSDYPSNFYDQELSNLLPLPYSFEIKNGYADLSDGLYVVPINFPEGPLRDAAQRLIDNLEQIDVSSSNPEGIGLSISVEQELIPQLDIHIDESYELNINKEELSIRADNPIGVNHALNTLSQLIFHSREEAKIPVLRIEDHPRFEWRGLMVDVSRHFISFGKLKEIIRSIALAKFNVLHLHLSDDQSFRVESKVFPLLHKKSSRGKYYTQDQVRELVVYANSLGVRVIPEFDMPAHVSSILTAYPELASISETVELKDGYGIFPNVLNPVNPVTYDFLEQFIEEMAQIFPDEYFHIGSDEVLFDQWVDNEEVSTFVQDNGLENLHQVHSYFILRVQEILKRNGKKMVAWDEALRQQVASGQPVIQVQRDHNILFESARSKINCILSKGWNLDHKLHSSELYEIDPLFNPNEIVIEPDTNNWQIWDIDIAFNDGDAHGYLFLFGTGINKEGMLQIKGKNTILTNLAIKKDQLSFNLDIGTGTMMAELNVDETILSGNIEMSLFDLPVQGRLIGADNYNGETLPAFKKNAPLSKEEEEHILGGEASIWTEWIDENNIQSRIWPNLAAVAEKLWSPVELAQDDKDFYRRQSLFSDYLLASNIDYNGNQKIFINEISQEASIVAVADFIEALEEVKYYERYTFNPQHNINRDLDLIADAVSPESLVSQKFEMYVSELFLHGSSEENRAKIESQLERWIPIYASIESIFKNPKIKNTEVLALALSDLSKIAFHVMNSGSLTGRELEYYSELKVNSQRKIAGVFLAPASHLIRLIDGYLLEI